MRALRRMWPLRRPLRRQMRWPLRMPWRLRLRMRWLRRMRLGLVPVVGWLPSVVLIESAF
jgi:hypothetical protein